MTNKRLSSAEKLKIINDSPRLWLKNFVKIVDNNGQEVPFVLNKEQENFTDNMDKFNVILKGRQIGFTTLSLGLMLHMAHQFPKTNYMLISYDLDSVNNIFNKLKMMYESIPNKHRLESEKDNRNELMLSNGSRISVKVASHKSLGRSFTCQLIHISEMAFFQDSAGKDVLIGLEQALAKNPNSKIIVESTANGLGSAYYDLFQNANKGRSKYKAFFYNWYSEGAKNQFKHELDLAEDWYKTQNKGVRLSEKDLTPYELNLYKNGATLKQLMWRLWKLQDMPEEAFRQEFPSTVEEAFISTDIGVFDSEVILERYNNLPKPIIYKNLSKPLPVELQKYYGKGFFIYEDIKPNEKYYAGVDVASGLGKDNDYSSISILDSEGRQVCQFYRNDIPVYLFAPMLIGLGLYFNYAMLLIERNNYGLDLINRVRKESGYLNVMRTSKFDKITGKKTWDFGFNTDGTSKTILINSLKEAFETGTIVVNDKETLDQMRIFKEKDGKFANVKGVGNHDDNVDSLALSLHAFKSKMSYI